LYFFLLQLDEVDAHLEELREMVVKRCRLGVMYFLKSVLHKTNLSYIFWPKRFFLFWFVNVETSCISYQKILVFKYNTGRVILVIHIYIGYEKVRTLQYYLTQLICWIVSPFISYIPSSLPLSHHFSSCCFFFLLIYNTLSLPPT
jgi:hypothetical protein